MIIYEERIYNPLILFPMSFKIHRDKVEVKFFPFKYEIPINDIISVGILEKIPWYVGWGLRINLKSRTLYFLAHHKKCVEISRRGGFWKRIVLSAKNPERFVETLKMLLKS